MEERYTILNTYYIQDNTTGKKYNQTQTCKQLNHLERIIQQKTKLIKQTQKTLNILEKTLQETQKNTNTTQNTPKHTLKTMKK
ncbi:MAG: hypothetical protein IJH63_00735 [Methanobrevibacter sp.]|nr:hypothetical protein [Methanosphaera sp.]MBR0369230.1 hypothetical protein [Methanobrevibacter sp.]